MDYFCHAVNQGISLNQNGSIDPCCQYTGYGPSDPRVSFVDYDTKYQTTILQPIVDDWANNRPHHGCQKCYKEEASGMVSLRNYFSKWYQGLPEDEIHHVELRLGNLCNLKCVMCFPQASSTLETEVIQHQDKFRPFGVIAVPIKEKYYKTSDYHKFLERILTNAKAVNITGGEPLLIPEVRYVLDYLSHRCDSVTISFNTNLTTLPSDIVSRLKLFPNLRICISLEGTKELNDYIRFPSDWNSIVTNLDRIRAELPQAKLNVSHTFQHSSVYALPGLAKFCFEQSLSIQLTTVQGFDFLNINSAPTVDVESCKHWAETTSDLSDSMRMVVVNLLSAAEYSQDLNDKFHQYLNTLDSIRGTDHRSLFTKRY